MTLGCFFLMINLHENVGPGQDRTHNPWIRLANDWVMPHLMLTVNNIAGIGVNLFVLIIAIKSGKCPSLAPTKNNLNKSKTKRHEPKGK